MKIKPSSAILLLSLPTIFVTLVVWVLMTWQCPTKVELDLRVERAKFTVEARETRSFLILNSIDFQSISVDNFTSFTIEPKKLEIADPLQYDIEKDHFPDSAWKALPLINPKIIISRRDDIDVPIAMMESAKGEVKTQKSITPIRTTQGSLITLEVRGDENQTIIIKLAGQTPSAVLSISAIEPDEQAVGTLDPIVASRGSNITLEVTGKSKRAINIQIEAPNVSDVLSAVLAIPETFQLVADNIAIQGIAALPYKEETSLTFRVQLRKDSPFVQFKGSGSLGIKVQIPLREATSSFPTYSIPVSAIDFTRQDDFGDWVSAVVAGGEISYSDYPDIEKVLFEARDFVILDKLKHFRIKKISIDPMQEGIRFYLEGEADYIVTKSGNFLEEDHRLSKFDNIWENTRLVILFSIVVWVFLTTLGAYRLYRDLKGD